MQTLAKVAKLDAVKQQLWGLELAAPAAVGSSVLAGAPRLCLVVCSPLAGLAWPSLLRSEALEAFGLSSNPPLLGPCGSRRAGRQRVLHRKYLALIFGSC